MEKPLHLDCVFERVADLEERVPETRFKLIDWRILFALDGFVTAREAAAALHVGEQSMDDALGRFLEQGLIVEREWSLSEYLEKTKTLSLPEKSPASFSGRSSYRANGASATAIANGRNSGGTLQPGEAAGTGANFPNGRTSSANAVVSFSVKKHFRLKVVLDFIQGHAGGGTLGQLAVYRTFMAIPSDVLRESGLQKLDFNDENIEIDSPRVRKAIVDAVSKTLRVDLPPNYFLE